MKTSKMINVMFLSFIMMLGLLNAADNITVGSRITIKASEIQISDGKYLEKFSSKIKAYAKPINNSADTIPLKVLTQPSDSSQLEEVKLILQKKVLLMNKKLLKTAYKAGKSASAIEEGKALELECHIIYNDKDYTIPRVFSLMPPKIEDITDMKGVHLENMPAPSQNIKVTGDFFGSKKPKVWLEYLNPEKNKIKPLKCKVIKPFEYKNSKGIPGKSCMDIDSGKSSISIVLPKKFPLGWNPEKANIVLQNKSAFTTITLPVDIDRFYSIMGKITGLNGISGVHLKCQNNDSSFSESTTTDGTGAYKFENLSPDTYIITPELAGFTYIPASQTVTLDNSNIPDVNFISQENSSAEYQLTVNNGTGSGQYAENDLVNISATVPAGKIFKEWAGDIQYIADTTAAATAVTMPAQNITVTAIFDDAPAGTYSLSGTVSGDVRQGVTVTVDATHSAVTDANGNYTISGLADGVYTVTPSLAGYTFTPAAANASISGADVTGLDFTAASIGGITYSISGTVSGDVQQGVTVTVDATHSAVTDANGNYTISGLADGAYTVTPSLAGYTFTPAAANASISGADVTGLDFTAASGAVGTQYTLTVNGGTGSGQYAENDTVNISATVPAGKIFKEWAGDIQYIADTTAAATTVTMPAQNITVTAVFDDAQGSTYSLSGTVSGDVQQGVTVSVDAAHSAVTDVNGNYTISGLADGTYTVTPSLAGYTFTPATVSATVAGADITGLDFTSAITGTGTDVPTSIAGCVLWLDGADPAGDGSDVTGPLQIWKDKSGNNNNAEQSDVNMQPDVISGELNGHSVVSFDGVDDYFSFTKITDIKTVFWVLKEENQTSDGSNFHFLLGDDEKYDFHRGTGTLWDISYAAEGIKNGKTRVDRADFDGLRNDIPGDQYVIVSLVSSEDLTADRITKDRAIWRSWDGGIAEIIIYNQALSDTDRDTVENYLYNKWFGGTAPATYSISGTISGDIQQGVTVSVDATHSAVTDANGNYTISSLADGTYTVIPSLAGYTFTPATANATVSGADVTGVDFTAASGAGGTQYTLTVNGGTGSGQYAENDTVNITATVPAGKIFKEWTGDTQYLADTTAASTTVTMPAQDITVTAAFDDAQGSTYSLSGTVSGDVQQGVTVSVDAAHSAVTDANGNYTINGLFDGSYTVTPALKGYTFTPVNATAAVSGADVTGVDFTAVKKPVPELVIDPNSKYRIENQFNGLCLQGSGSFLCDYRTVGKIPFLFEPVGDKTFRLKSSYKNVYLKSGDNAGDLVSAVKTSSDDDTVWEVKKYILSDGRDLGVYTIKNIQTGLFLTADVDLNASNLHDAGTEKLIVDTARPGSRTQLWTIELFVRDSLEVLTGSQGGWTPNTINKCALLSSDTSLGDSVPFSIDVNGKIINGNALLWGQYWHDQYFYIINLNIPELETVGDYKLTANGKETTIHITEKAYSHPLRSYGNDRFTLKDLLDDTWGFIGHWGHLTNWYPNGISSLPFTLHGSDFMTEWLWLDYDDLAVPNNKKTEPFDPSWQISPEDSENALKGTWDMTDRYWHSYSSDGIVLEQLAAFYKMTEDEDLKKQIVKEIEYGVNGMILNQEQNGSWRNRSYAKTFWTGTTASLGAGLMYAYPVLQENNSPFTAQTLAAADKAWTYVYGKRNDPASWAIKGEGVLTDGHTVLASYPPPHRNGYTKDFLRFALARYIVKKDSESKDFIDDIISRGGIDSNGRLYHVSGAKFPGEQEATRSVSAIIALLEYYKYATPDQQEKILEMSREYYLYQIEKYDFLDGPAGMLERSIYLFSTGAQWQIPAYLLISSSLYDHFGDEFGRGVIVAQRIIDYWYGCNAFATSLIFGVGDRHLLHGWLSYEALGRHLGASSDSGSYNLKCIGVMWEGTETSNPGNSRLWRGIHTFEKVLPSVTSVKCYNQENITGTYSAFLAGKYNSNHIKSYGMNPEDILSIDIPDGFTIQVFDQDSWTGNSETFTSSQNTLQSWAGKIKSFIVNVYIPHVKIISPAEDMTISAGTPISLQGYATDPQDNVLSGSQLVWMNGQTTLGTGESLSGVVLPAGKNVIELHATDNDNNTVVATITVTVN